MCVSVALVVPTDASAQASLQIPLEFDFVNPGARSRSVGGGFAGLADDATAALTNPAGLTILTLPEVSIEGIAHRMETPFLGGGRLSGQPSGLGVDTAAGPLYKNSVTMPLAADFVSFVLPRQRYAFAIYRHQLLKLHDTFETAGVFQSGGARELALTADREFNIANYGVSGAARVTDQLSIGVGLSVYRMELRSHFSRYTFRSEFAAPVYSSDLERARSVHSGDDVSAGVNVGVLWSPHTRLRMGAVFRQGPGFDVTVVEGPLDEMTEVRGRFNVPSMFALGVAVRLTDTLNVSGEVTPVRYAALQSFVDLQSANSGRSPQFSVRSGVELHAGLEYALLQKRLQPAVRFGGWYDPEHSIAYEPTAANDRADERYAAYLAQRGPRAHVTAGGGVSFSRRLELNIAGDFSSHNVIASASIVARF